jgi:hypothetical protein
MNWQLQQHAGNNRDSQRFTGYMRGLRKIKTLTINKKTTECFHSLFHSSYPIVAGKAIAGEKLNWDFQNVQDATVMFTDLPGT